MTFSVRSIGIFVASLSVGASIPLAASQSLTGMFQSQGATMYSSDGTPVQLHKAYNSKDRADYSRALDIYKNFLQQKKTGLVVPNINDRKTIDIYLNDPAGSTRIYVDPVVADPVSTKDYKKPVEEIPDPRDLSRQERDALARSQKVGKCWEYPGFSAGYMAYCKKLIQGKPQIHTGGIQSDLIKTRATGVSRLSSSSSAKSPSTIKGYTFPTTTHGTLQKRRGSSSSSSK